MQRKLKTLIGNYTFLEAYERTGRILNVSVCPADTNEPARLLNYLTAPQVRAAEGETCRLVPAHASVRPHMCWPCLANHICWQHAPSCFMRSQQDWTCNTFVVHAFHAATGACDAVAIVFAGLFNSPFVLLLSRRH